MITNAHEFTSVSGTNGRVTPFNTGKVQIGLLYQPKPPGDDEFRRTSGDGMVLDPSSCALVACDVGVVNCGFSNNFDCGVTNA